MADSSSIRHVVVVGASLAGVRAAEQLRRRGFSGRLTLVGRERHFPPYDRPPLSKEVLSLKWEVEDARLRIFEDLDATIELGHPATALRLDPREVVLDDGRTLEFDGLIIATGTATRRLRCPGADLDGVLYFRDVEDCVRLRAALPDQPRVTVIGGGFIGSEVASVCRGHGAPVTMVDVAELPMEVQVGPQVAAHLMGQHRDHGVDLRLGIGVAGIDGDTDGVRRVQLSDGASVETDLVVVGIGVTPVTGWLEGSGLMLEDGVVCDEHCRALGTSGVAAGGVTAVGDVARWVNPRYGRSMRIEHWTNAAEQAEYGADALLDVGTGQGFDPVPYFWSDQYDARLQFAGVRGDHDELVDGSAAEGRFVLETRVDDVPVGVISVNWPARFQKHRRALVTRPPCQPLPTQRDPHPASAG